MAAVNHAAHAMILGVCVVIRRGPYHASESGPACRQVYIVGLAFPKLELRSLRTAEC